MGFLCNALITWLAVAALTRSQDSFYFSPQPRDLDVVKGRSATLECNVSNSKHIVFYWTLNNEKLRNTTRRHQQGSNLHITRVDPQHDLGEFKCIATNVSTGISVVSQAAQINILWISDSASVILQSQQSTLEEGGLLVLQCKVDGYPEVHVEWYRNGMRLFRSERVTLRSKRLDLSELSLSDNGIYSCRAANDVGSIESTENYPLILRGGDIARIIKLPKDEIVPANDTAKFDCVYENAASVLWYAYGNNSPLTNDTRIAVYVNGSVHISSVQDSDEGIYQCTGISAAESNAPKQTYSARLHLAYIEELNQNNFEPRPRENGIMVAPENGLFEVICIAPSGRPKPNVIWLDPAGHIISDTGRKRVDDSRLIIDMVKENDIGNYTCTAENLAGETEASISLYVTVPPVIISKDYTLLVNEGESATLFCNFISSPYPVTVVRWLKDKKYVRNSASHHELYQNGTFLITNVQLSDAGSYICEVNTTGFDPIQSSVTMLNVKEKLKFVPPPVNKNLELHSNAKIYCKARGTTAPVVKWLKEGRKSFKWPPHIRDENGTLHFNSVQADDAGRYTCIATNSQGIITTTIRVDVIVLPKFVVQPADTEAYEGYSAMIHCRASGDPLPTIQWDKNNVLSGFDPNRFVVMQNGSLYVKEVHMNDEGKYGCTAGNSGGFKRAEMSLTVKSPEDYYPNQSGQGYNDTAGTNTMTKTVMITLGAAAVYMTLVIGLMIWCRFRRARRKALMLTQASAEVAKVDDGDAGADDAEMKDKCRNGDCRDGNVCKSDGELQSSGSHHSKRSRTSYDKLQFPQSDLQMMMLLGRGEYGDVYLSKASGIIDGETDTVVMVKLLQTRDENAHFEYKREMEMFHKLHHCNIARLLGLCRDSDPFMMILEYSDWGDLKQFLLATRKDHVSTELKPSQLSVAEIIGVCHQVALGMENLSNHRFTHKDLATRNCLISSKLNVKVSCSSLSKDTYAQEYYYFHNKAVPLRWAPAEAVLEDEWSTKSDVWSFAVLVWEVFNQAEIPFRDKSDEKVLQMLKKQQMQWCPPSGAPESLCSLLTQCWNQSPKDRPCFSEIVLQIQNHIVDSKV